MTPDEFKAIRHRLKLSTVQFGRAFGYTGSDNSASVSIRTYESGGRPIPEYMARLATMFNRYGVPPEFFPVSKETAV